MLVGEKVIIIMRKSDYEEKEYRLMRSVPERRR
jgi:hypothetical protein